MNYNRGYVFVASCAVIFIFGISVITLGATLPQLSEDFGLSEINMGTLASALPIGILIGSLAFGPIVDRHSYKFFLAINVILIMAGFILIAWASSFIHLIIAFVLIGTGGGSLNGASSSLVSDFSDDLGENKGANLSILGTFFGVGALSMPVLLNIFSSWFNYRQIIGGVGLLMTIPIVFILTISYPAAKQSDSTSGRDIINLLKSSVLLALSFILFFQAGWESLINNWITTYLTEVKRFSGSYVLAMLTYFTAVFTIGRFTVGLLLRRYSAKMILLFSTILALFGFITLTFGISKLLVIISLTFTGFGLASAFPVILGMVGDQFSQWSGTAFGIALTIALLGNMFFNYLTGFITEIFGVHFYACMVIAAGASTLITIVIVFSRKTGK